MSATTPQLPPETQQDLSFEDGIRMLDIVVARREDARLRVFSGDPRRDHATVDVRAPGLISRIDTLGPAHAFRVGGATVSLRPEGCERAGITTLDGADFWTIGFVYPGITITVSDPASA